MLLQKQLHDRVGGNVCKVLNESAASVFTKKNVMSVIEFEEECATTEMINNPSIFMSKLITSYR